jgi:hypothetical protein
VRVVTALADVRDDVLVGVFEAVGVLGVAVFVSVTAGEVFVLVGAVVDFAVVVVVVDAVVDALVAAAGAPLLPAFVVLGGDALPVVGGRCAICTVAVVIVCLGVDTRYSTDVSARTHVKHKNTTHTHTHTHTTVVVDVVGAPTLVARVCITHASMHTMSRAHTLLTCSSSVYDDESEVADSDSDDVTRPSL